MTGSIRRVVHGGINHSLIDSVPENRGRSFDQRLDENGGIQLIDVILVHDSLIKTTQARRDSCGNFGPPAIKKIGKKPAEEGYGDRDAHQRVFQGLASYLGCGFLHGLAGLEDGSKEMLEVIAVAYKASHERE